MTCARCKKQYVGKTDQSLKQRHYGHRREIELQSTPLGKHFAQSCGYQNWRMQVSRESPPFFVAKLATKWHNADRKLSSFCHRSS